MSLFQPNAMSKDNPLLLLIAVLLLANLPIAATGQPTTAAHPVMHVHPNCTAVHPIVHPSPNDTPEAELANWLYSVRYKILESWNRNLRTLPPCHCSCTFEVGDNERALNVKLLSSSGAKEIDQSFLDAVSKAKIFEEKLVLHRTVEVDFVSTEDFQLHCKLLPEIAEKNLQP